MTATQFTALFVSALATNVVIKFWLAYRQLGHVAAHRAEVPAAFHEKVDLAAHQKAADYTRALIRLDMLTVLFEAALLLGFTLGGGIQWLSTWVTGAFSGTLMQGTVLIVSVLMLQSILESPFDLYRTFNIEVRFGFNKMTLKLYLLDALKGLLLGAALGLPLLFGVLWLMERMGDLWWLYVWGVWVLFNLLLLFIYPTYIAPLFNDFEPLQDEAQKARIEELLHRCGFSASGLFVMDGSKRSTHGNAYFTGFGKTKRIVFFDTLLERLTANEVDAVLAHELGHFKHRHVIKRIAFTFALSLGFLWLLAQLLHAQWFYQGLGITGQSTALALLLFFMVMPVFTFLLHPIASAYSRKHEFEADAYAASHTDAHELVNALVKLYQDNAKTLTPDPLYATFYESHPPAPIRIAHLQKIGGFK
ncbi:M48 family metallopeptidase [Sideroxydans lithotrophicus]|uniref:Ste24 endopeptidase n=1 Tax=Sideroxydans lithotrophicus (strain ES-1) TaxID=580332 RepID=D5CQP4_SIDLE|nr:M48 family metallopeptidase [Sideroxydans lithotrophicus]ADE11280.1 Ste24 endopeptidase [Sideroxydans lithotrophicus ES-1]